MGLAGSSVAALLAGSGAVLGTLDIDGFLVGSEMAALAATLLATFFGGLANAIIGGFFGGFTWGAAG